MMTCPSAGLAFCPTRLRQQQDSHKTMNRSGRQRKITQTTPTSRFYWQHQENTQTERRKNQWHNKQHRQQFWTGKSASMKTSKRQNKQQKQYNNKKHNPYIRHQHAPTPSCPQKLLPPPRKHSNFSYPELNLSKTNPTSTSHLLCACNDPAKPAQFRPLKRKLRRRSSCSVPDVGAAGCRTVVC